MAFWVRAATLTIGNRTYDLDKLHFSFEVPFEASEELPVATITVTNLSENTRANIKKNQQVILNAGYEGDIGCILIGKVVGLKHKHNNTDWATTLTVQPCADKVLGKHINKTYKKGMKAKALVKDLLNIYGIEVKKFELQKNVTYSRGRVCKGKLIKVLEEIVVDECKSRLVTLTTGQIIITKANDGLKSAVKLTEYSGLLRADKEKVMFALQKKQDGEKKDEDDYISRSCLLNYGISAAVIIKIQSDDLNGKFIVEKGVHKGSLTGDWKTEMELKPY